MNRALILLFTGLNGLDLASTYHDLHIGLPEGNPLMRSLINSMGFGAVIAWKVLTVALVLFLLVLLRKRHPGMARRGLVFCNVILVLVVTINLLQA